MEEMVNDRVVYDIANKQNPLLDLKYHLGPPKGEKLFATAIADYFLKKLKN